MIDGGDVGAGRSDLQECHVPHRTKGEEMPSRKPLRALGLWWQATKLVVRGCLPIKASGDLEGDAESTLR